MGLDTGKAQQALVRCLDDGGICGGHIYDFTPETPSTQAGTMGQTYPFCTLDSMDVEEDDVGRELRSLVYQVVQVWTDSGGKAQAQSITDAIKSLMHQQTLQVSEGETLRIVWENTRLFNDGPKRAYRGVMRFRIHHEMEKNS